MKQLQKNNKKAQAVHFIRPIHQPKSNFLPFVCILHRLSQNGMFHLPRPLRHPSFSNFWLPKPSRDRREGLGILESGRNPHFSKCWSLASDTEAQSGVSSSLDSFDGLLLGRRGRRGKGRGRRRRRGGVLRDRSEVLNTKRFT